MNMDKVTAAMCAAHQCKDDLSLPNPVLNLLDRYDQQMWRRNRGRMEERQLEERQKRVEARGAFGKKYNINQRPPVERTGERDMAIYENGFTTERLLKLAGEGKERAAFRRRFLERGDIGVKSVPIKDTEDGNKDGQNWWNFLRSWSTESGEEASGQGERQKSMDLERSWHLQDRSSALYISESEIERFNGQGTRVAGKPDPHEMEQYLITTENGGLDEEREHMFVPGSRYPGAGSGSLLANEQMLKHTVLQNQEFGRRGMVRRNDRENRGAPGCVSDPACPNVMSKVPYHGESKGDQMFKGQTQWRFIEMGHRGPEKGGFERAAAGASVDNLQTKACNGPEDTKIYGAEGGSKSCEIIGRYVKKGRKAKVTYAFSKEDYKKRKKITENSKEATDEKCGGKFVMCDGNITKIDQTSQKSKDGKKCRIM